MEAQQVDLLRVGFFVHDERGFLGFKRGAVTVRLPPTEPEPSAAVGTGWEITSTELKVRLDRGDNVLVVDVREPNEYQINRIAGSVLIPLGELPRRHAELPRDRDIVMQCKVGARSAKAMDFLKSVGFTRVQNLRGGILDWIDKVDPSQPKY